MNKLVKFITTRKIHFFSLAMLAVTIGIFFYLDESQDWLYGLGVLFGGASMWFLAMQAQDIDRDEGRYYDKNPFEKEE